MIFKRPMPGINRALQMENHEDFKQGIAYPASGQLKLLLPLLLMVVSASLLAQSREFTREEMVSDLQLLRMELEAHHPKLYTYRSAAEVDAWFEDQVAGLPAMVSEREAFRIVASIAGVLQDGHFVRISRPWPSGELLPGGLVVPFQPCLGQR